MYIKALPQKGTILQVNCKAFLYHSVLYYHTTTKHHKIEMIKLWMGLKWNIKFFFLIICRALQFIPAPTSPWLVRKHFLLDNKRMLLAIILTIYNVSPVCIYLYIIINVLNETEYTYLKNGLFLIPHWNNFHVSDFQFYYDKQDFHV